MRFRLAFVLTSLVLCAWVAQAREFTVVVFNVENLTGAEGRTLSEDYLPKRYSRIHLMTKLNNLAKVLAQFNDGAGPDIILFQEIERDFATDQYVFDHAGMLKRYKHAAIEDMLGGMYNSEIAKIPVEALLLKTLADRGMAGYRVAASDDMQLSGPRRYIAHINVVFSKFPIGAVSTYIVTGAPAVLEVQVEIDGYPLYLFNNDWKQGAVDPKAEGVRVEAAKLIRERLDEIFSVNPSADIIIAGDFNCFFNQKQRFHLPETAMQDVLKIQNDERLLRNPNYELYNLWNELPSDSIGTGIYYETWSTFMQMIVSRGLYDYNGIQYVDNSFGIGAFAGLNADDQGKPIRWSFKGVGSGYSDQFPVFARFTTVKKNRKDVFLNLPPVSESTTVPQNGR